MAIALVTLAQAKQRCRVFIADEDADLQSMIEEASAAVIARVDNVTMTDLWVDDDSTPREATAATLELVLFLYERDTTFSLGDTGGRLPPRVELLLARLVTPALA